MTALHGIAAVLWPLVAAYAVYGSLPLLKLAIERFAPVPKPIGAEEVAVPHDLVGLAMQESEPWAQRDMMRVMREKYAELRDWNAVRRAMGVATRDDA